tara:strand:- start:311 stop:481 length:171 start_codon:yes stop_codon:yes gene_type:complete
MKNKISIFLIALLALSFGQYDYNLEDLNSGSPYYQENVGTSYFSGKVTLHYFGHYN